LAISQEGLRRRAREDGVGLDETKFINPLFRIAESNFTAAEELLAAYSKRWNGDIDRLFREFAY
jgi:glutamate--cysteine ligase